MSDHPVLTCEEALRFLAAYLDGELGEAGDREVESHLARCRSCYSRAEFEKRMKQRVGTLGRPEVPAEFAARIRRLVDRFTASPHTTD
jgi:anti-sigma factor (TIGR02949 family)